MYFRFEIVFDYEYILPNDQCAIRACAVGMGALLNLVISYK